MKQIKPFRLAVIAALTASVLPGHHSFSAMFDGSKPLTLTGTVTKVEWANPHVYFYIDVTDGTGKTVNWACETAGTNGLIRRGWRKDSLKVGDKVTVKGYPARNGSNVADARLITLADGREIFGGSPGDGGPQPSK